MIKLVLKEILHELREIRKELQIIRNEKEFNGKLEINPDEINQAVRQAIHGI